VLVAIGGWLLILNRDYKQLRLLEDRCAGDVLKGVVSSKVSIVLRGVAVAGSYKGTGGDLAFTSVKVGRGGRVGQLLYC
jgi:hypothetical protein